MEEEIETILENATDYEIFNETSYHYERPMYLIIHEVILFTAATLALIADIIIATIVIKNKRMQTKHNLMIMNVALCEAMFLYCIPQHFTRFLNLFDVQLPPFCSCILETTEFTYLLASFMLLFVICMFTIMESHKFTIWRILGTVYGIITTLIIIDLFMCTNYIYNPIIYMCLFIMFVILIFTIIIKDVTYYCKDTILEAEVRLSYNLARITIYNWLICVSIIIIFSILFLFTAQKFINYIWVSACSNGIYMLVYLVRADADFKVCFYNLFKRVNNEGTVSFVDDFYNPVDEVETVSVSINNNEGGNTNGVIKICA